ILGHAEGHLRMAKDTVGLPQELGLGKAAELDEVLIDIGNMPQEVSLRNDQGLLVEYDFDIVARQVISHRVESVSLSGLLELGPFVIARRSECRHTTGGQPFRRARPYHRRRQRLPGSADGFKEADHTL